jgi:phospholipid-transporting ATPase
MVLQLIPQISITGGQPALLLPLSMVITVSAIKDLVEDRKRGKSDAEENNRNVERVDRKTKEFETTKWRNLKVG